MDPASLSEAATAPLRGQLHATTLRIYQALHRVAVEVAAKRGYSPGVTTVTYHLPTELLAFELGMSRTTLWTHVKTLKAAGLIDQRAHTTTAHGQRVKDGSLWSVRLDPQRGKRVRLRYDELSHAWRDLEGDIRRGSTVFRHVEQSESMNKECVRYMVLVDWALSPGSLGIPVGMTVQKPAIGAGIEALLDLPHAPKNERNQLVDTAANAVAAYLGDTNLDFYRYLAWQLLRRHDEGDDRIHTIYEMILRAGADRQEGFARNAGALLTSRLKDAELWGWLRDAPPIRVGSPPLLHTAAGS